MKPATLKTGNKRLLILAEELEKNADNKQGAKFDLHFWGLADEHDKHAVSCGTKVCAVGLACLSPRLPGLNYTIEEGYCGWHMLPYIGRKDDPPTEYDTLRKEDHAAARYFGIDHFDVTYLFMPESYGKGWQRGARAERHVAKRIRQFVADRS